MRAAHAAAVVAFLVTGPAGATTVTYQDGVADPFLGVAYAGTEDTFVLRRTDNNAVSNWNFGGSASMNVGYLGDADPGSYVYYEHALIRFDLSSLAGHFGTITDVVLQLTIGVTPQIGSDTIEVHALADANAGWVQGTVGGPFASQAGSSSWSQMRYGQANWAGSAGANTPGVDYGTAVLGSASFVASTAGTFQIHLTNAAALALVASWASGGTNAGFFLRTTTQSGTSNQRFFAATSENGSISARPALIITYSDPAPPPDTGVPEPGSLALGLGLAAAALVAAARGRLRA